ncbi:YcnI family protein [Mycobacterium barrassiae]|uniref:YcnI family copper-binding membrane protein n=1 Tax=Mycobacterium barrassiae TaxID=319709 RepID=UPI0022657F3F|nr:YcnI family protein [Mycobacterium barrassiae]MCV7299152.1 YcnI family protein [Mycobacterium barrassiae]
MKPTAGAASRALIAVAVTSAMVSVGLLTGTASASAHVRAESDNAMPGKTAVVTFRVPGESETGALTTQLKVELPDVASARTEVMQGWTAQLDRAPEAGTVSAVTWTAAPGTGISPDQFALFRISVKLPEGDAVSFPTTQTYSDGTVVRWDQPSLPDGSEPEYPAPTLALGDAETAAADDHPVAIAQSAATDNSARWLAGGALAVAAIAVATTLLVRRRS